MKQSEFERRAAEMKARNLGRARFRNLPPPRSIFDPPLATAGPVKVHIRDYLRDSDLSRLSTQLAAIKKLDTLETDRDGLLSLAQAGVQISVSPELLRRAIRAYEAVLKVAAERGWYFRSTEGGALRVLVAGGLFELAVMEKTGPTTGVRVRPGERCPRKPNGAFLVSLTAGDRKAVISDKRGTQVESNLTDLFDKAEVLGAEVRAEHDRVDAIQRQRDLEYSRRIELEARIDRLNQDAAAWRRAGRIRGYIEAVAGRMLAEGPMEPESNWARWLAWARRYADSIDPTCGSITVAPQEFWD